MEDQQRNTFVRQPHSVVDGCEWPAVQGQADYTMAAAAAREEGKRAREKDSERKRERGRETERRIGTGHAYGKA